MITTEDLIDQVITFFTGGRYSTKCSQSNFQNSSKTRCNDHHDINKYILDFFSHILTRSPSNLRFSSRPPLFSCRFKSPSERTGSSIHDVTYTQPKQTKVTKILREYKWMKTSAPVIQCCICTRHNRHILLDVCWVSDVTRWNHWQNLAGLSGDPFPKFWDSLVTALNWMHLSLIQVKKPQPIFCPSFSLRWHNILK